MPEGSPPLALFTTLARDERLFERFMGGGLLDRGHLTLRQREAVLDRVTAQCGSEYEWGVHVADFAAAAGFDERRLYSFRHGDADDPCWENEDRLAICLCDSLASSCDVNDKLWALLADAFSSEAILEMLLLAGFYRTISILTRALRLPLEAKSAAFPPRGFSNLPAASRARSVEI